MKRLALLLLVTLICSAYPARAQTSVSEEAKVTLQKRSKNPPEVRRLRQVEEAASLLQEKDRIEKRILAIETRLGELDKDAEPIFSSSDLTIPARDFCSFPLMPYITNPVATIPNWWFQ